MFIYPPIYYTIVIERRMFSWVSKNELDFPESGSLIRQYRKLHGLSIKELAVLVDINEKYLSNLECGNQQMSLPKIYRVSQVLGVPMERLLVPSTNDQDDRVQQIALLIESASPQQLDILERFITCILPICGDKEYK